MSVPTIYSLDNGVEYIIRFIKNHHNEFTESILSDSQSNDIINKSKQLLNLIINTYLLVHAKCEFMKESSVIFLIKLNQSKFFKYINEYIDLHKLNTIDNNIKEILDEFFSIINNDCQVKETTCKICLGDKSIICSNCITISDTSELVEIKVDYQPLKHCSDWIDRIQGKEKVTIPEEVITHIKNIMQQSKISMSDLNCVSLRKILKVKNSSGKNLSKYNNSIVLIKKIITGEPPAELTIDEINTIKYHFQRAVDAFNNIKDKKDSASCHSYIIFKILEFILPTDTAEDVARRRSILGTIHKQSRDTTIKNDNMWKRICEYLGDIKYCVTTL